MNLEAKEEIFRKNYEGLLGLSLPHMDTVDALFRELKENELEQLKAELISILIEKKVLDKSRLFNGDFMVAYDGTGMSTYDADYCGECLHRTYSTGSTTYFHYVLEAKLVTESGLSLSLATEWIANTDKEYDKQDCELNAFVRLAAKVKKLYPRLPTCVLLDGLFTNKTGFDTCRRHNWNYITNFKDGNLRSVWEEIRLLPDSGFSTHHKETTTKNHLLTQDFRYTHALEYGGHSLNYIECKEKLVNKSTGELTEKRFVHLTNLVMDRTTAPLVSQGGRFRWRIENEGFNTQKNQEYNLEHKFSRVSFLALKNYYQCMQIGHLINQLVEHSTAIAEKIRDDPKLTIKHLWKQVRSILGFVDLEEEIQDLQQKRRCQIRLT